MYKGIQIIAEVKIRSPFGWESSCSWETLFDIAVRVGDIISIHTDQRWGGSFELLKKARSLTSKPILAKGIHKSDQDILEAIKCGANFVLVVGRVPEVFLSKCLIEPLSLSELQKLPRENRAIWNSRDLGTGGLKQETFADARALFDGWLCQASNLRTRADIHPKANAVLVGMHLQTFAESLR